ncbi:hypothetical protein CASFOL_029782 [Castilleja foliolosa]|uniref:Uncharacterized protein n=1 Tax=Castilleja foliolosa TaxID=1961234 RepID=A0ABD3C8S9_9LAMI
MEALLELDDDIFYKDLSNQISLLIMDDDDDYEGSLSHCTSVNFEAIGRASKGTGVFIPLSSSSSAHTRKKSVKKGKGFTGKKSRKACDHHNSKGLHKMSYTDNIDSNNPSHDHFKVNLKRF